jgi:hypothetical protein
MASNETMYQFKVTLNGVKPPIWRRLLVPSSFSLKDLHKVLQVALGWTDSHLHGFIAKGRHYGIPDPEFGTGQINESRVRLDEVLSTEKDAMTYEYDFGDGWGHKIVLEKVLEQAVEGAAPSCIAGARACPPEDCGGPWGYTELLKIIADPAHPEHDERLEWLGGEFDPERFDLSEINSVLARMKRRGPKARSGATSSKRPAPSRRR